MMKILVSCTSDINYVEGWLLVVHLQLCKLWSVGLFHQCGLMFHVCAPAVPRYHSTVTGLPPPHPPLPPPLIIPCRCSAPGPRSIR